MKTFTLCKLQDLNSGEQSFCIHPTGDVSGVVKPNDFKTEELKSYSSLQAVKMAKKIAEDMRLLSNFLQYK